MSSSDPDYVPDASEASEEEESVVQEPSDDSSPEVGRKTRRRRRVSSDESVHDAVDPSEAPQTRRRRFASEPPPPLQADGLPAVSTLDRERVAAAQVFKPNGSDKSHEILDDIDQLLEDMAKWEETSTDC